jgi:hypothetical protein
MQLRGELKEKEQRKPFERRRAHYFATNKAERGEIVDRNLKGSWITYFWNVINVTLVL